METIQDPDHIHERRLKALISATSDIVSIADYQGKIIPTFRTGDWQAFTGQSYEDTLNNGWKAYIHPEDVEYTVRQLSKTMTGSEVVDMLYRVRRRDGQWRWLEGKIVPVFDDEGKVKEWVSAVSDITERKQADEEKDKLISRLQERERELAASEEELRQLLDEQQQTHAYIRDRERHFSAIFNNARDVIFSLDKNLCITAMNKAFVDLIKERKKMDVKIGDNIFLILPAHAADMFRQAYQQVLDGNPVNQVKQWGDSLCTEEFFEPIFGDNDEVNGIAIFSRNITERKKIEIQLTQSLEEERKLNEELAWREEELTSQEEELRSSYEQLSQIHEQLQKSEKKFEAISICTNGAIYDWDILEDNLVWSPGFKNVFGYDPSGTTFTLQMWEESLPQDSKQATVDSLKNAFENGLEIWDEEYKIVRTDGQIAHVAEKGQIFRDEQGVPYRMVGGIRDITDQKRALEDLEKASYHLNCIIDNMPIGIMVIGKDGNVLKMNKAYVKSLQLSNDFDVTGHYDIQKDKLFIECGAVRYFEAALKGEIVVNEEIRVDFGSPNSSRSNRKDKAWFSFTMFPIFDSEGTDAVVLVSNEITAAKLAQEKIEKNTQQIIETNKQMAEYRLIALRSVMNPHFLFNSLNSIQSFIATNEKKQAIDYLSLFSKLIRSTLNSSLDNSNTMAEELEILKLYINLEKLRFDNKFSEYIDVEEGIDVDVVEIPPLILQPFVENAILHGLYNKEGNDGRLDIRFRILNGKLLCVVEDNGIGRQAAEKIKASNKLHKSVGMMLTKERIELINKGDALSVQIVDLMDEFEEPAGTRVEVMMDILNDNFLRNDEGYNRGR